MLVEKEQRAEVWRILDRRSRLEPDYGPTLARPSGRGPDRSPGLSLGIWAGLGGMCCHYAICWAEFLLGSGSIGDPRFMNPTGAPEPFWDFGEVMKGLFTLVS